MVPPDRSFARLYHTPRVALLALHSFPSTHAVLLVFTPSFSVQLPFLRCPGISQGLFCILAPASRKQPLILANQMRSGVDLGCVRVDSGIVDFFGIAFLRFLSPESAEWLTSVQL